ncbi:phage antirepressor N-terminal domain-containing protein [Desulfofundulus australicus]|uniref:phage antirepressor N-terminal domain-containing protein n=1 Tax=Desulfofundulus australicus TaxID=1566 RepID=UPI001041FEF7|nr:phage antirepressor N-terminal domain-containing protein [Desulfofundulus australicus]
MGFGIYTIPGFFLSLKPHYSCLQECCITIIIMQVTSLKDVKVKENGKENGQETVYVPVKRLCENLGLAFTGQRQKIVEDRVLREGVKEIFIPIKGIDGVAQMQKMLCLRYDLILMVSPFWRHPLKLIFFG